MNHDCPSRATALALTLLATCASGQPASAQTLLSPSYAVVIGVTQYKNPGWPRLDTAEPDTRAVQNLLRQQGFRVTPLLGATASRAGILKTLRDLAKQIETDRATTARVVVYFAGHGATETVGGNDYGYIVPWDAILGDTSSYVSMDDLINVADRLKVARHQLYLLDSCFGGSLILRDPPPRVDPTVPGYLEDSLKRKAIQVLTAGSKDQSVVSNGLLNGHSPFTGAVLEAIEQGLADFRHDGTISFDELVTYVVPRATNRYATPLPGTLPGDGRGNFIFRSPLAVAPIVTPVATAGSLVTRRSTAVLGPQPQGEAALRNWQDCAAGKADACRSLGNAYREGTNGLLKDMNRAAGLYQQACDGGSAGGCNNLGVRYANGDSDLPKDLARATALYKQACDAGDPTGCNNLGLRYTAGDGSVPKDLSRAVSLYRRACDGGSARGCTNLGRRYATGEGGLAKDPVRAVALYKQGCDGGDASGCNSLGVSYASGAGGLPKDPARAVALYKQACDGNVVRGCTNLGIHYEKGSGGVPKDVTRARALYKQSCDAGDATGCEMLQRLK